MTGYDKIKKFVLEVHEINCALTNEIIEFIDEVIEQEQVGNVAKPDACPQLYEGWRDANKELPEIEGEYLCISKWITNDLGQIYYRIFYFDGKKWLTDNIYDQRFVAWRPLPDPPAFV